MTESIPPTPRPITTRPTIMIGRAPCLKPRPAMNMRRFPRAVTAKHAKMLGFRPDLSANRLALIPPTAQPR